MLGAQAPLLRVRSRTARSWPLRERPFAEIMPDLLAISDVLGTAWFAADAANVKTGSTVAVVGDGAVGLLGVLVAKQMGAERVIALSRHPARQQFAREFGATDIVTERGSEGVARIKDLTDDVGADSVLACVGSQESMWQAIRAARPGGWVGYVGVPHDMSIKGCGSVLHARPAAWEPSAGAAIHAGPDRAGARPEDQSRKVFDLTLALEQVAEGYRAMDERRAIKTLLRV